jgi:hypothetical protein
MTKLILVFRNFANAPDYIKIQFYRAENELRLHYKNDRFCKDEMCLLFIGAQFKFNIRNEGGTIQVNFYVSSPES